MRFEVLFLWCRQRMVRSGIAIVLKFIHLVIDFPLCIDGGHVLDSESGDKVSRVEIAVGLGTIAD